MKFIAASIVALASVAAAAPGGSGHCEPGTYACLPNKSGWEVCNTSGEYVFAGNCPPKTICKFFEPSKSPYCVPKDFNIH